MNHSHRVVAALLPFCIKSHLMSNHNTATSYSTFVLPLHLLYNMIILRVKEAEVVGTKHLALLRE